MWRILENLRKTFFYWKKIQLQVSKLGYFGEKKSKSLWVAGTFVETTSEAKCPDKPRIGVAKLFYLNDWLVLHVLCRSRVHLSLSTWTTSFARSVPNPGAPNYDAPPLPAASAASGNVPIKRSKKFLWFFGFFLRNKAYIEKMCRILENLRKKELVEKNPTSSFKKVGILVQIPYGK